MLLLHMAWHAAAAYGMLLPALLLLAIHPTGMAP
jgi:hypothetical protein